MMNEGSKAGGVGRSRLYLTLISEALVASILPPQAYPKFLMKPPFFLAYFCQNSASLFCKSLIINI
jgi:hypothetical protein